MELRDYIRILRRSWLLIVLVTILGVASAAAYSLTRTPEYDATSTVFVSAATGDNASELQQGNSFTLSRVATYTNLVTTPAVMDPVIKKLHLDVNNAELSEVVKATNTLNTLLISIAVTDPNPAQAASIANALATSLSDVVEKLETPQGATTSPVQLSVVRQATAPAKPTSPNVPLNLALGLLVGLALGIGVAVMRSALDTRIRTGKDLEDVTEAPLIGAIPNDPKIAERPLVVHDSPLSSQAESFRTLRTNLQFLDMGGRNSFVITSSMPGEGKSTTAVNLAVALADSGKKVALLDTDLRKPRIAELLGLDGGAGLTDVLIGRTRVGDVMHPWGGRPLYAMPAGRIPPNPSELLDSTQMRTLLTVLERDFDVVLCDAPPLLPVTDAAILAKAASGALVVAAAASTTKAQLGSALDVLQTVDAKAAGIVLTKVATRGPDAYGGYGYRYGNGTDSAAAPPASDPGTPAAGPRRTGTAAHTDTVTTAQLFDQVPKVPGPLHDANTSRRGTGATRPRG